MSPTMLVLIEAGLIFGGALVFAIWQLVSVRRWQRRERERRAERDGTGDGGGV